MIVVAIYGAYSDQSVSIIESPFDADKTIVILEAMNPGDVSIVCTADAVAPGEHQSIEPLALRYWELARSEHEAFREPKWVVVPGRTVNEYDWKTRTDADARAIVNAEALGKLPLEWVISECERIAATPGPSAGYGNPASLAGAILAWVIERKAVG